MDSPCKKCLMVPLCRRRHYMKLLETCRLLFNCLFDKGGYIASINRTKVYNKMICKVEKDLKPVNWKVIKSADGSKYKILGKVP